MIKKILPATVLSLSLISCQMGLKNFGGSDDANFVQNRSSNAATTSDNGIEISYDENNVYLRFNDEQDSDEIQIYINTDGNSATGFQSWHWNWNVKTGAEFLIATGNKKSFTLSSYTNDGADWPWYCKSVYDKNNSDDFSWNIDGSTVTLNIALSLLKENEKQPSISDLSFGCVMLKGGDVCSVLPSKDEFTKYTFKDVELTDSRIKLAYDCKYLYVSVDGFDKNSYLFINTDSKTTGYTGANWKNSGVDYFVNNAKLYKFADGPWTLDPNYIVKDIKIDTDKNILTISLADLGIKSTDINNLSFAYDEGSVQIPSYGGDFASVKAAVTVSEKTVNYEEEYGSKNFDFQCSTMINKGIIIPAYIELPKLKKGVENISSFDDFEDDVRKEMWEVLVEAAGSRKDKDFFVVVNSAHSGPFTTKADDTIKDYFTPEGRKLGENQPHFEMAEEDKNWKIAKFCYNEIKKYGGKIIGYVHTCDSTTVGLDKCAKFTKSADGKDFHYYGFRTISDVQADIIGWYEGLKVNDEESLLDGIWLDEFYPRYELMTDSDPEDWRIVLPFPNENMLYSPTQVRDEFPNKDALLDSFGGFAQMEPYGGYYWQICKAIKDKYPELIKIGNAGAALENNQLAYGKLVDILVCFEADYIKASGQVLKNGATDAAGIASKKLALIHGVQEDSLTNLIYKVLYEGDNVYSHVCVTDRGYGTSGEANVWGGLPSYLKKELEYIVTN